MIFVTVGTHEQAFNRLVEYLDKLKENKIIDEEIVIQTGYSTYEPKCCKWQKLFSYKEMEQNVTNARIVITHGGPASFIMPLQIGKIPIVVPRQYQFGEHVNDHQVEFVEAVSKRMNNIIPVFDIDDLENTLLSYDMIVGTMNNESQSNNTVFNDMLEKIVDELFI